MVEPVLDRPAFYQVDSDSHSKTSSRENCDRIVHIMHSMVEPELQGPDSIDLLSIKWIQARIQTQQALRSTTESCISRKVMVKHQLCDRNVHIM